jgi:5-methylcytosine-specific restriction endonuclease McrA
MGSLGKRRPIHRPLMTAGRGDPRGTQRWKKLRKLVLAGRTRCARCGLPFILLPPRNPRSPTVDHIRPLALGGAPYDLADLIAVCYSCNSRGGQAISHPPRIYKRPRTVHRW